MKRDIEIAREAHMLPIGEIAGSLGLQDEDWAPYGHYKAKLSDHLLTKYKENPDGKVILMTSINPTPAGEGKSTMTVGLGQALNRLNKKAIIALREPSLGPTLGMKGGAAGGGYSQVVPMEEINLHFTGDLHAITTANNALSALIDNHIHHGNALDLDPRRIVWKRVMDLNDRALRQVVVGLGGPGRGIPREDQFSITVASEIMAVLCLADSLADLKKRLSRMLIGYTYDKQPVYVHQLGVQGALTTLLKDAIKPNLVQTLENTPAIIHGGPFANIAHGCNSLIATKTAAKLGEYVVTEAGFGADLGAEKFLNIKTRAGNFEPSVIVIVATIRALKLHGDVVKDMLTKEDPAALERGLSNLQKHIETVQQFGIPFVVAINKFSTDAHSEIDLLTKWCQERGYPISLADVFSKGGEGGVDLAEQVVKICETNPKPTLKRTYELDDDIYTKFEKVAQQVYGADGVEYSSKAKKQIAELEKHGFDRLPICMAKTQYSLSDDPKKIGRPSGFTITVQELRPSLGAGFIVALTGDIMTMPGLPKKPSAMNIDIHEDGSISGLN